MLKKSGLILSYIIFIFFLILVFGHMRFPEKRAAVYFSNLISEKFKVSVKMESIDLKIPFRVQIKNPVFTSANVENLGFSSLEISPSFLPLLAGKLSLKIKGSGLDGHFFSKIQIGIFDRTKIKIDLNADKIDLFEAGSKIKTDYKFRGSVSGDIHGEYYGKTGSFSSSLVFEKFSAEGGSILVPLAPLKIKNLMISGRIKNRKIILNESNINSDAGVAGFKGSINISKPLKRSALKINGKIIPNLGFLGKNKDTSLSMLFTMLRGKTKVEFSLMGSPVNPRVKIK